MLHREANLQSGLDCMQGMGVTQGETEGAQPTGAGRVKAKRRQAALRQAQDFAALQESTDVRLKAGAT